jgi:hypothetical protein
VRGRFLYLIFVTLGGWNEKENELIKGRVKHLLLHGKWEKSGTLLFLVLGKRSRNWEKANDLKGGLSTCLSLVFLVTTVNVTLPTVKK